MDRSVGPLIASLECDTTTKQKQHAAGYAA